MKRTICLFVLLQTVLCAASQQQDSVVPAFPFLVHFPNVRDLALSASGDEAYFTVQSPLEDLGAIACMKKKADKWLPPILVSFTGHYRDIEPFLQVDGLRLYFSSNRPLNDTSREAKDYDIWYVERKTAQSPWSLPVNLGAPVNSASDEFYPSLTLSGNLYFTSDRADSKGKDDIYLSEWKKGSYSTPHSLDSNVNTDGYEFNAFVSPDESFILYTGYARKDGLGSGDLYASFKGSNGEWQHSISLGKKVNSAQMDYCPFVDMQTGTLYFTSRRSAAKKRISSSIRDFETAALQYENGFSRLYKISIRSFLQKQGLAN